MLVRRLPLLLFAVLLQLPVAQAQVPGTYSLAASPSPTSVLPQRANLSLEGQDYDLVWTHADGLTLSVYRGGKARTERHRLLTYRYIGGPTPTVLTDWNPRVLADEHLIRVASQAWKTFLSARDAHLLHADSASL